MSRKLAFSLIALVLVLAVGAFVFFRRDVPEEHADIVQHFMYGSIGADTEAAGLPYWIWLVLPRVFPDYLPNRPGDGYQRLGFVYESPAHLRPIGTSYREKPLGLVGLNCAVCHTGLVRDQPDAQPRIILGMPAHQFDIQGYFNLLFNSARDPRFTADVLIPAIREANPQFPWWEELLYRHLVIPQARNTLLTVADQFGWAESRPPQGPGRVDTFNPYKARIFNFDMSADTTIGTADLPPLFTQRARQGIWLHWDGNNDSVDERNRSAAMGAGATPASLDNRSLARVADWVLDLPPPRFPSDRIDQSRVPAGATLYQAECASCHAFGGARVGEITPLNQIGTDPERVNSFTPALADRMNTLGTGYPWQFSHFRKTDGYANMPLDGIWLRAPYLHNGSVPTLRDLLRPPAERPTTFIRGYTVYDFGDVGFVSSGADAERAGTRFATSARGNSNQGHDYGTRLSPEEINNLLEFLKTQ
jgi:hypothetical protein